MLLEKTIAGIGELNAEAMEEAAVTRKT